MPFLLLRGGADGDSPEICIKADFDSPEICIFACVQLKKLAMFWFSFRISLLRMMVGSLWNVAKTGHVLVGKIRFITRFITPFMVR